MKNVHEDFEDHFKPPELSAPKFGFALGGILLVLALIKGFLLEWWIVAGICALSGCALIAAAFFHPSYLEKPKALFLKIAPLMARIMNPVLMGFIFVICFIPAGLILKALKRDPLHRAYNPYATTYWKKRDKHELPDPMKYQF